MVLRPWWSRDSWWDDEFPRSEETTMDRTTARPRRTTAVAGLALAAAATGDQNRNGVLWTWSLGDNGARVGIGQRRTAAPSGSFTVHARIADRPGADRITARALLPTGAVCQGVVTV